MERDKSWDYRCPMCGSYEFNGAECLECGFPIKSLKTKEK